MPKMPVELQDCSLASPITVQPRFSARLTAPCIAISVAMLSVSPLPTARKRGNPGAGGNGGRRRGNDRRKGAQTSRNRQDA